jgi:hypothetical protein
MACLRAAFTSLSLLRCTASLLRFAAGSTSSGTLHSGQRLAKPGLSGLSSNSFAQIMQTLIGKAIASLSHRNGLLYRMKKRNCTHNPVTECNGDATTAVHLGWRFTGSDPCHPPRSP